MAKVLFILRQAQDERWIWGRGEMKLKSPSNPLFKRIEGGLVIYSYFLTLMCFTEDTISCPSLPIAKSMKALGLPEGSPFTISFPPTSFQFFRIGRNIEGKKAWLGIYSVCSYFEGSFHFLISLREEWFVRSKWRGVTDI